MALGRKTGGRKAGTPNRVSAAHRSEIAASGLTPLEYMLQVLRDENELPERRMWAAVKAAPFVHPKLSSIRYDGGLDIALSHEERLKKLS